MSLSEHPRATAGIRRAKGAAGLGVFLLVALLSLRAGLPAPDAALRGLLCGVAAYFLAWAVAVTVWRQIALGELEGARRRRQERIDALAALDEGRWMDPVRRIERPRQGIDPVFAAKLLPRVERDEDREEPEPRQRRPAPQPPVAPPDDGLPHIDVRA